MSRIQEHHQCITAQFSIGKDLRTCKIYRILLLNSNSITASGESECSVRAIGKMIPAINVEGKEHELMNVKLSLQL